MRIRSAVVPSATKMARWGLWISVAFALLFCVQATPSFTIENDRFVQDNKEVLLLSGSIHYSRVVPQYWKDRLLRLKALGANAVQTYVPWNFHEPVQGQFDFSGPADLVQFLQTAQDVGLLVLLRMGPYMCGEWEFGGFPAWIIAHQPPVTIRTYEQGYISLVDAYWAKLLPIVQPMLYENGGPVVMVQIENEFGSYGDVSSNPLDKQYMQHLLNLTRLYLGPNIVVYTTDGGDTGFMSRGTLPGQVYTVGDFGPGSDPASSFAAQKQFNAPGKSPNFCSEYYTGWLTHWSEQMANTSSSQVAYWLQRIIALNGSVNLYMGHGGTNFAFWSGANGGGNSYQPTITSYDYDSPISEGGEHGYGPDGDKFLAVQAVFQKANPAQPTPEPPANPVIGYGSVPLTTGYAELYSNRMTFCPKPFTNLTGPASMEMFGQNYGFILYSTTAPAGSSRTGNVAVFNDLHDRVQVFVNGVIQPNAVAYRPQGNSVNVSAAAGDQLDFLVENMGRLNYGRGMYDPKGITSNVQWNGNTLGGNWTVCTISLDSADVLSLPYQPGPAPAQPNGPTFYRGSFKIASANVLGDTYLGVYNWTKGMAWINGNNIGRHWEAVGPQHTLYVPQFFLQVGSNDVVMLELHETGAAQTVQFVDAPDFQPLTCRPVGEASAGDLVVMWDPDTSFNSSQQWIVNAAVKSSTGVIQLSSNPSLCLSAGPKTDPTTGDPALQLQQCDANSAAQQWKWDASHSALVSADNNCMDVTAHGNFNGAPTEVYLCNYLNCQTWSLPSNGAGVISGFGSRVLTSCQQAYLGRHASIPVNSNNVQYYRRM
eukprot:TRINITY_DN1532_c0_g1_i1.p1 TRINITY_DN1532_c0_g1~~TRINITY_DN1532_c0_g1_i1.p1  ORF type:complete len:820 (-),score=80.06 TRINITY_DN1532_c0_g1_i1:93-2552(-)